MANGARLEGKAELQARLRTAAQRVPQAVAAALFTEAEVEMAEAVRRTPVDTGALRASRFVEPPRIEGREISVSLGFGGPAAPYAIHVHEDLDAYHEVGEAKYLEGPLRESAPHLPARLGRRLNLGDLLR